MVNCFHGKPKSYTTSSFYFQDYHWWWRSFLTSGFTAVYFFIYCIHYYVSKMEIVGFASTFLYFGYMLIVVVLFFLLTGKIYLHLTFQRTDAFWRFLSRWLANIATEEELLIFSSTGKRPEELMSWHGVRRPCVHKQLLVFSFDCISIKLIQ